MAEKDNVREELRSFMQKEVAVLRDLLANMHQEELALLMHDPSKVCEALEQRALLITRLSNIRLSRMQTANTLDFEQLLTAEEGEILTLRDQIIALLDRMSAQSLRNQRLSLERDRHPWSHELEPKRLPKSAPKRKSSLATYPSENVK